jgi:LysR family glycine cleavage system transcriptional activator
MRQPPGIRTLRTLAAAGRHLNFTRAAEELGLTAAAVSHQIKDIEDQLGVQLFQRNSRSIRLTEAGRAMCDAAEEAIGIMSRATTRARRLARGTTAELKVTVDPQLATKWLMRRVDGFRRQHPGIELRFDVTSAIRNFDLDDIDVAIRFGTGQYPGLASDRLFETIVVPVCSPRLLAGDRPLREPRDLLNHTLAHIEWSRQGVTWPNWQMWMAAAGVADFDRGRTIVFAASSDAVEAAIAGEAVALADFAMVANDLSEGRLVRPFALSIKVPAEFAYFFVCPEATATDPRIVALRGWLLAEAATTRLEPDGETP